MPTREQRLQALEQSRGMKAHRTALVLILTCEPTPDQQAAIDDAEKMRRPVLIIRGQWVDFGQSDEITLAQEEERPGFTYDEVPMREWR
jgi:hypothetical protein